MGAIALPSPAPVGGIVYRCYSCYNRCSGRSICHTARRLSSGARPTADAGASAEAAAAAAFQQQRQQRHRLLLLQPQRHPTMAAAAADAVATQICRKGSTSGSCSGIIRCSWQGNGNHRNSSINMGIKVGSSSSSGSRGAFLYQGSFALASGSPTAAGQVVPAAAAIAAAVRQSAGLPRPRSLPWDPQRRQQQRQQHRIHPWPCFCCCSSSSISSISSSSSSSSSSSGGSSSGSSTLPQKGSSATAAADADQPSSATAAVTAASQAAAADPTHIPPAPASPPQPQHQQHQHGINHDHGHEQQHQQQLEQEQQGHERWQLQLFNTMGSTKQPFRPLKEGKVGMYVCGVTVYDYSHIGHARVYVSFDVLYRFLRDLGFDVMYVRNFTDVDDKILRRAAERGEDPLALAQRFIGEFHADMRALRCLPPSHEPRVSDHIADIVDMIARIVERGHGYVVEGGDVFFAVDSAPAYGQLSGRRQDENRAGERVEVDGRKRNPADFALWKSTKAGEAVAWDSPWGRGRPGWHIECSAMSVRYLGFQFDIHGGGRDLVFPHHENELAQSAAACPDCAVACWLHNGFVNVDAEKMSKSLGNFFTIREVLEQYDALALRWFLLATHYRSPINYSQRQIAQATDRIFYVYQLLVDSGELINQLQTQLQQQQQQKQQQEQQQQQQQAAAADSSAAAAAGAGELQPAAGQSEDGKLGGARKAKKKGGSKGSAASQQQEQQAAAVRKMAAAAVRDARAALLDDLHTGQAIAALSEPLRTLSDLTGGPRKKLTPAVVAAMSDLRGSIMSVLDLLGFPTHDDECHQVLSELRQQALRRAGMTQQQLEEVVRQRAEARQAKDFARADAVRAELAVKGVMLMDTKAVGGGGAVEGPAEVAWCPSACALLDAQEGEGLGKGRAGEGSI